MIQIDSRPAALGISVHTERVAVQISDRAGSKPSALSAHPKSQSLIKGLPCGRPASSTAVTNLKEISQEHKDRHEVTCRLHMSDARPGHVLQAFLAYIGVRSAEGALLVSEPAN